ncbi:type I restriction endonuclease subunit R [Providencia manganoxydans]|uniref:type I restriction endonuclease subunit R n=1 Tax=Providencia manganoxydans TaxID=2923283 RepID=UPI0029C07491|nr:type I restriction endonuclease subunit R [Providencia manganoxydans]MDX4945472.1 type I restriction endonuclease subunit R [Providencia manganoxydans]
MQKTQSEFELEQDLIQRLTTDLHYDWVDVHDEASMKANLRVQIEVHNKLQHASLTDGEFERIYLHLTAGNTVFERAKVLRDYYSLSRDDGSTKWIRFINKEDWCCNEFQVTNQVRQYNAQQQTRKTRFDVTLLINGLPLVQIELKRRGLELKEAFHQIDRYHRDAFWVGSGLYLFTQIFIISNGVNTKYYANNKSLSFEQTFFWADKENNLITHLHAFTAEFLKPCHIAKMITHYTVLKETAKCLMVMRPYQMYACEAIIEHVQASARNGYIWHTTGSGKTLTSFKASQVIMGMAEIDKVIFVVDRRDLDDQTAREFNAFKKDSVDTTNNTRTLVSQLIDTDTKLVLTTIQKLNTAITQENHMAKLAHLQDKRVIFIFDECHRSQFGETHRNIRKFFRNSQLFGFTGTPIFAENVNMTMGIEQTTEMLFDECLHKYVIVDAIRDENVLRFSVEYLGENRTVNPSHNDAILTQPTESKAVLESETRLSQVVDYILDYHDAKTAHREFTALFCVGSVELLIRYYHLFKIKQAERQRQNPHYRPLKIATIFTYAPNEPLDKESASDMLDEEDVVLPEAKGSSSSRDHLDQFILDYNRDFKTNQSAKDSDSFRNYYVDIAERVKNREIDILLVVNMFLTGFDSPPLNTLYVDKNLRYHGLIQAFSRTNRILGDKKKQGNIVSFRNLKQNTDDAIRLFSNKNAKTIVLVQPYNEYLIDYREKLQALLDIAENPAAVDLLYTDEEKEAFVKAYRDVLRLRNIMNTFIEHSDDNLVVPVQMLEDFKSKYLDIYDSVRRNQQSDTTQPSSLTDIDFELSLIHRDDINVGYILRLLGEMRDMPDDKKAERKKQVLDIISGDTRLRSKQGLIQQFIENDLSRLKQDDDIQQIFQTYLDTEKQKAIDEMCERESLKPDVIRRMIEKYLFEGRFPRTEEMSEALIYPPKILQRKKIFEHVNQKLKIFFDTFIDGLEGL